MQTFYKLALLILLTGNLLQAKAQESLGDPVLNETFGVGSTYTPIGPPLSESVTNLHYVKLLCPPDGAQYTIASSTGGCLGDTWHVVSQDATKPSMPGGYMMVINASEHPDIFYTQRIPGSKLCAGAKYQFAVNILNILRKLPQTEGYDQPDITFIVEDSNGNQLQPPERTSIIAATEYLNWKNYTVKFTAPISGDVIVKLRNNTTGSLGNDLVLDDITVRPYGPVIDAGLNSTLGDKQFTQCLNDGPASYHLKSFVHNYAAPQYQWQRNYNNQGWENLAGKVSPNLDLNTEFQNPQPGKYQYRVGALSAPGQSLNCQTFSEPIIINVVKNPTFKLPAITWVCQGDPLAISAIGGSNFEWILPDGSQSEGSRLEVAASATTAYEGIYSVTVMQDGCSLTSSTQVKVAPPLNPTVDDISPVICEGQAVQIGANGGVSYKWTPSVGLDHDDIARPIANPTETTEYTVEISNGGCSKSRTVKVTVIKNPVINAGQDRIMKEEQPITLHGTVAGDNVNYYWTPTDYMDNPSSLSPTVSPHDDITYTLHAESLNNCGLISDNINIHVLKKITIPNSFSPNGDGINDLWQIDKLDTYPESVLTIYTRGGQEVFQTLGNAKQWNGNYGNIQLPAGTYYYVIDLKNNLPKQTGWVVLIR